MASADEVQLPDLQVIQRYSLAVRGATAPVADVVAALQADLAWLTAGARRTPTTTRPATSAPAPEPVPATVKRAPVPVKKAAAKKLAAKRTPVPVKKAAAKTLAAKRTPVPVKRAAAKTLASKRGAAKKKSGTRRG
jgi:DNA-binding protein HU-beta